MFGGVYEGKTVLVTGDTGFKGAWLTLWLTKLGARVCGYALPPPTAPSLFESCGLAACIEHPEGDIRDTAHVQKVIQLSRPDFLFHLAAHPLVRDSYADPLSTYDTNVMGTLNVFDRSGDSRELA